LFLNASNFTYNYGNFNGIGSNYVASNVGNYNYKYVDTSSFNTATGNTFDLTINSNSLVVGNRIIIEKIKGTLWFDLIVGNGYYFYTKNNVQTYPYYISYTHTELLVWTNQKIYVMVEI